MGAQSFQQKEGGKAEAGERREGTIVFESQFLWPLPHDERAGPTLGFEDDLCRSVEERVRQSQGRGHGDGEEN